MREASEARRARRTIWTMAQQVCRCTDPLPPRQNRRCTVQSTFETVKLVERALSERHGLVRDKYDTNYERPGREIFDMEDEPKELERQI